MSRPINETIRLSEGILSGFMSMIRVVSESISIQSFDGLKARAMVMIINEIMQISTLATSTFYSMVQVINETLGISETKNRLGNMARFVSESVSLSDYKNQKVVIWFFPKASTPG